MDKGAVIFISGRDPQRYPADSHCCYVRTHAHAATAAGYQVHLVCLDENERLETTPYGIVHAHRTWLNKVRQNMLPVHAPILVRAAVGVAAEIGRHPIIIHGFGAWGYVAATTGKRLRQRNLPCVSLVGSYTTHVDENESQWRGIVAEDGLKECVRARFERFWSRAMVSHYERRGYRDADRILVNYRSVQRMITRRYGGDLKCDLIPYTVEKEFQGRRPFLHETSGLRSRPPVIICIAEHYPRKGVDVLIKAFRRVKEAGHSFSANLIGGGRLLDRHRRLAQALGLSDCVKVLGFVPSVDDFLANADIFVLPSREEQSGSLALLEAMRVGVPCIASACDGIPEDVSHKLDAWLTIPGDASSLTEGITALLQDGALRQRLAHAGRQTFERRFSGAAFCKALDEVYRESTPHGSGA